MPTQHHTDPEPPAARWLGRWLALVGFVTGLLLTVLAALVSATMALSNANHTMEDHTRTISDLQQGHKDDNIRMDGLDRRLNEGATNLLNSEREQDSKTAELKQRIVVLESLVKLFGERTVPASPEGLHQ